MSEALIVDAVRTPFGRHGGGLAPSGPTTSPRTCCASCSSAPACPRGDDRGRDPRLRQPGGRGQPQRGADGGAARRLPESVGGATVNRLCGSGMDAIASAARAIRLGEAGAYVAGGVESMSRAPFVVPKPSRAYPTGPVEMVDTTLGWRLVNPRMEALGHTDSLGQTAENLAAAARHRARGAGRFALRSHAKAVAAADAGRFAAELAPVEVTGRKGERHRRAPTRCRGATPRWSRWAGSSRRSPATAASPRATRARSTTAPARSCSRRASTPARTGWSRSRACAAPRRRACRRASWASARCRPRRRRWSAPGCGMDDMGLVEVNEAFAAQVARRAAGVGDGSRGRAPERQRRRDRARPPARRVRRADRRHDGARAAPPRRRPVRAS